jgi:hypothetical protein
MAGPWGVLPVGPTASATEVEEDVDDGPSGGGALSAGPTAATTEVEDDVNGEPPGGVAGGSGNSHHRG